MRVLLTGATGFLGKAVASTLLEQGHELTAVGWQTPEWPFPAELLKLDLTDARQARERLSPFRWEAVIHLAGPVKHHALSWPEERDLVLAHARLALGLMSAVPVNFAGKVIAASSMTVYGNPKTLPVREEHSREPRHLYGMGKVLSEDICESRQDLDLWTIRLPGLFSADRKGGALYAFAKRARAGEVLEINAPEPTPWDILDVRDAAAGIARALRAPGTRVGPVNLSYGGPVSLPSIAQTMADISGQGSRVEVLGGVEHPPFQLSIDKARRLIGWQPPTLTERLRELYEAYAA